MSHATTLAFSAICTILLVLCRIFYNIYFHPLRHYPGPKIWAASRLRWAYAMQSGTYHLNLRDLHAKYGPVVRVAPDELSFTEPGAWKDIYENRNIAKTSIWAGQEEHHHPISIVSTDEATHLRNRRALAGAFTEHAISEHMEIIGDLIQLMMLRFSDAAKDGKPAVLDLADWFNFLTFDISGALSFGESFDSVASSKAHPWVAISCGFGKGIALMASINFFSPLNKLLKLAMPHSVMEKMKYHKEISHQKLLQRLSMEHKTKTQDYVGSIMAYNKEKGEIKIPQDEIEANMTLLIFAGSETTSTAMTAIVNGLLQNPSCLEKVQREVREAFDSEEEITDAKTAKLQYLTAVIQEGIRMGPPAAIGLPRVTPARGSQICRKFVPGNTLVAVNQYPTFRSASNFTQPDSFVPERFLRDSPFPSDRIDAFEPFLLGRHKCIGQKLAWTIMRLTLARLLFSFDLHAAEKPRDFGTQKTYIFWEKRSLKVELRYLDRE
ncbi:hypothetical protein IAQ61_007329 [Plenodomus lingam]|uniref:Similar to benzoate 4-monooxygenase cytochrome P450 n=1 Tax=Leptosphaeria maculans (strain JN3 / isolate v23.1.3 / race Av1-4-5-6-7-8) TaxID=985895 RepID=E5A0W3_LEPMJ|nr:similar to benzoate 4-monooxygenase cytochrome P450 [Plenodomus lingam JN3]KAH9868022.1 hypothetical protein IAQ61_007329 [Plenodomus lingam]CBX97259.1 similar to benzoate 4-monooxygenase cytochrome P450 [Plenodomus lingam JN3]